MRNFPNKFRPLIRVSAKRIIIVFSHKNIKACYSKVQNDEIVHVDPEGPEGGMPGA